MGRASSVRIAVITDGENNVWTRTADEVRNRIKELRKKEIIESSVIIGMKNPDFTEDKLLSMKQDLGFAQAMGLDQNPKTIRKAFVLASKPPMDPK